MDISRELGLLEVYPGLTKKMSRLPFDMPLMHRPMRTP